MSTFGIMARPGLTEAGPVLHELVAWLVAREVSVCIERDTAGLLEGLAPDGMRVVSTEEMMAAVDALLVLGGDGTLLAASHRLDRPVPILGINFGSLGFLTETTLPELYASLQGVLDGTYQYEERRMLRAVVHRGAQADLEGDVLNDVVLAKGATLSRIIQFDVTVDGLFVSSFRADGIIISSPTGSTAYNLAAGGPILHPTLPAMVLTPICPHMLTNRPLVVGDGSTIEVRLGDVRDVEVHITLDGQRGVPIAARDSVTVTRSPRSLRLVKAPGRDYYEVLRTKLKWGESTLRRG